MKLGRRKSPLALLLLAAVACEAASSSDISQDETRKALIKSLIEGSEVASGQRASPIGTERAPVDGKDGMPHEGPWVQTDAERKKNTLKDSGDEKIIVDTRTSSNSIPQTNDGVMDDRNRKTPQDGTRGTEGGVSEKSKDDHLVGKKPEQPKEAPPMPHSEKEKIKSTDESETIISDDGSKKPYAVCTYP